MLAATYTLAIIHDWNGSDTAFLLVAMLLARLRLRRLKQGSGSVTNLPDAVITRTEKVIRGSFYGSVLPQRDFPMFLDLYSNGKLKLDDLVTRRYALDEINEAYQDMLTGEVARGIIAF